MPPIVQRLLVPFSRGGGAKPLENFLANGDSFVSFFVRLSFVIFFFFYFLPFFFFSSFFVVPCLVISLLLSVYLLLCFYSLLCARGLKCETCRNFFIDLRHSCTSVAATRGERKSGATCELWVVRGCHRDCRCCCCRWCRLTPDRQKVSYRSEIPFDIVHCQQGPATGQAELYLS